MASLATFLGTRIFTETVLGPRGETFSESQPKSDGQTPSAFLAAALDDFASVGGTHFFTKSVSSFSFSIALVGQRLFHGFLFRFG